MPGTHQITTGILASPDQIAGGLLGLGGHRHRRQLPDVQQPGRVALVGLDPVSRRAFQLRRGDSAIFDEDNLVSHAGLVPLLELAEQAGLSRLLAEQVRFTSERIKSGAANATPKLTSIIAGMAAGADSIDDLAVIRSGGMNKVFGGVYASATLGILLREFTYGHARQLSAVLRRHLIALAEQTPVLAGIRERAFIDIDSLLRPVYEHAKQGASFGHTKIAGKTVLRRGLSLLAVTIGTQAAAPVLAGMRLRAGRAGLAKGAACLVTEATNTAKAAGAQAANILVRGDCAHCSGKVVAAVVKAGATFSFAITRNPAVDAAIATIGDEECRTGDRTRARGLRLPGQKCSAASRAYIPRSLWEAEVRDRLAAATDSLSYGDVTDLAHFGGAVIDARAHARLAAALNRIALSPSCQILSGGKADDREGYLVQPTLVVCDDSSHEVFTTEYFGPNLAVQVYDDDRLDETATQVERTSAYALTGAIFGTERTALARLTAGLRYAAGNLYLNDKPTGAVVGHQPFGGARASGTNDKAGSMLNLLRWTSARTIKETFAPPVDHVYPHMR